MVLTAGSRCARAEPPTVRLRVEWSSAVPVRWSGNITVEGGTVSRPNSLGTGFSDAGTVWLSNGALAMQRREVAVQDAIEFSATAAPDAILNVLLRPDGTTDRVEPVEIRLADLYHAPRTFEAAGARPRIAVRRAPGDALALRFDRPHLVFNPQEVFHAAIVLRLLEDRGAEEKSAKATVRWKLYALGGNRSIADGSAQVNAFINSSRPAEVPIQLRLPDVEGTYQLRISATGRGFDDVERQVQLIVIDPVSPTPAAPASEKLVDAFEPGAGGNTRLVVNHSPRKRFDLPIGRIFKRGPSEHEAALVDDEAKNWQAFRLRVTHTDRPHRLRLHVASVNVPAENEQSLGVCIFELDEGNRLLPNGPNLQWNGGNEQGIAPELIFWPRDREPVVLIHRSESGAPVRIDRIELFELGDHLPIGEVANPGGEGIGDRRLCGPYLARPWLARNFGAPQVFDAESHRGYDDWKTYHVAAQRLIESVRMQGGNALLLAAAAEGSALYPSRFLDPSVRFDAGAISLAGQDPIRKDVLELLFRIFDREGVTLIPELQFTAPLPQLEGRLRERKGKIAGLRLVDHDGRSWAEVHGIQDKEIPWYNPLDERAQEAIIEVVRELTERYRHHPSFGGVACELNPRGYLQYPGLEWGYDLPTIERFAQSAKIRVPGGTGPEGARERFEFLTTSVRREWMAWRSAEIGRFHSRIAASVAEVAPTARVLFTGSGVATDRAGRELTASEMVQTSANPVQQLLLRGINFAQAPLGERVTTMRPVWTDSTGDQLGRAALLTLNQSPGIDAAYRGARSGTLLYTLPNETRIRNCSALFDQPETDLVLPADSVPDEVDLRRRYAHAVGALDSQVIFEGGGLLPLSGPKSLAAMRRAIGRLPATAFQPLAAQTQPAIIRTARFNDATWLSLVNSSSLPTLGHLVLGCDAQTLCVDLASDQRIQLVAVGEGKSRLEWELGPHAIWCCRLDHPNAAVHDVRAVLPSAVLANLGQQVERLHTRMNSISERTRSTMPTLQNAGFEEHEAEQATVAGWKTPDGDESAWALDKVNPRSGKTSLRLTVEGERTSLVSAPLPVEGARNATLSLWMRSNRTAARVELTCDGRRDERGRAQRQLVEVGKNWRKYEFRVTGGASAIAGPVRLRVDALDACQLWIDDLELDVQGMSADQVRQSTKTVSAVRLAWEQGRYADCQRLLEGYWGRLLLDEPQTPAPPSTPTPAVEDKLGTRVRKMLRR